MGSMSIIHWLVLIAVVAIFIVPCWLIFRRAGWSPWLSLILFVPGAAIVMLWVFALAPWPNLAKPAQL